MLNLLNENSWIIILCGGIVSLSILIFQDFFKRNTWTTIIYYILFAVLLISGIMFSWLLILALVFFISLCIYYPVIFLSITILDLLTRNDYGLLDNENRDTLPFKERIRLNKLEIRYCKKEISKLQIVRFFTYILAFMIAMIFISPISLFFIIDAAYAILLILFIIVFALMFDIKSKTNGVLSMFLKRYTDDATHDINVFNGYIEQAKMEIKAFKLSRELTAFEKILGRIERKNTFS